MFQSTRLKKSWVLQVLKDEVSIHKKMNCEQAMVDPKYAKGFLRGLRQAILIIKEMD